ncbi:MAG: hypothetical protein MZW92_06470 [Comamonadaceae bacterium]|nr:hypothetical protein [Comamonadaceae bacterium]
MMVVNVDLDATPDQHFLERTDAVRVLRIDDDETLYLIEGKVPEPLDLDGLKDVDEVRTLFSMDPGNTMTASG